ncbi:hypothetical protein MKW92_050391 [Papaver armeniacum]|nr:hypothetical protein MKW92_050391 [Papaver armeniacum]
MGSLIPETARKVFTSETLRSAAKQSERLHVVPLRLRRPIKKYLRDDETLAYVASRMPAVYSACHRILREVRRRLPGFQPATVLDFGSGTGSALWALREIWPHSLEKISLVEPSKAMQRAAQSLTLGMKDLPLIKSYDSIQALNQNIGKSEREHDLVIASYVLGEIPSLQDRITVVRQLWDLTQDVLVLVEPGTPQGFNIISQMRSHILWLEKRRCRKTDDASSDALEDLRSLKKGAFVVAPCGHDGACPLENTGTYCHFVQRMQRTSSERLYKRSKGKPLRGFEDEKFCFVVLRRGQSVQWPLDDTKFGTLKELRAKIPEELESDSDDQFDFGEDEEMSSEENPVSGDSNVPEDAADKDDKEDLVSYNSDVPEDEVDKYEEEKEEEEVEECPADLGTGWGRIIFAPMKRGKQVLMHVCRSAKRDGSEGALERVIVTQSKNPALHRLAKKSFWGDLWPLKWEDKQMALSQQHKAAKSKF